MSHPVDLDRTRSQAVTTFHLNVQERQAFASNPVPGTVIRSAVLSILEECSWFPPAWRPEDPYEGAAYAERFFGSAIDGIPVDWLA